MREDDADEALLAVLRAGWRERDPVPVGLVERMIAAVAVADVSREYALLTLVEGEYAAVRGESDTATLQFSDGQTSLLLHVTADDDGDRRVDGWVDAAASGILLVQGEHEATAAVDDTGRFAFEGVRAGLTRVRLDVTGPDGQPRSFQTPQFEV